MATATFLSEGHIYEHDGMVVPSVTQVLGLAGINDVSQIPLHYLERAAGIGTAVHQACEFLDQDDLDLGSVDPSIVGYVLAYQRFKEEHQFFPLTIEQRTISNVDDFYYGMCVDRIGMIGDNPFLLDLKTASKRQKFWPIQTAAYAVGMADRIDYPGCARACVHLAKEGTYDLIPHADEADFEVWWAALRVAHWKLTHGTKLPK